MSMTPKRSIHLLMQFLLFISLHGLFSFFLKDGYVVKWVTDRYYLGIWIIVLLFILIVKKESIIYSYFITVGNFVGILAGEYIGGTIKEMNMMKITKDMDAENIYRLSKHYGVFLWLITIIISFVLVAMVIKLRNNIFSRVTDDSK